MQASKFIFKINQSSSKPTLGEIGRMLRLLDRVTGHVNTARKTVALFHNIPGKRGAGGGTNLSCPSGIITPTSGSSQGCPGLNLSQMWGSRRTTTCAIERSLKMGYNRPQLQLPWSRKSVDLRLAANHTTLASKEMISRETMAEGEKITLVSRTAGRGSYTWTKRYIYKQSCVFSVPNSLDILPDCTVYYELNDDIPHPLRVALSATEEDPAFRLGVRLVGMSSTGAHVEHHLQSKGLAMVYKANSLVDSMLGVPRDVTMLTPRRFLRKRIKGKRYYIHINDKGRPEAVNLSEGTDINSIYYSSRSEH